MDFSHIVPSFFNYYLDHHHKAWKSSFTDFNFIYHYNLKTVHFHSFSIKYFYYLFGWLSLKRIFNHLYICQYSFILLLIAILNEGCKCLYEASVFCKMISVHFHISHHLSILDLKYCWYLFLPYFFINSILEVWIIVINYIVFNKIYK